MELFSVCISECIWLKKKNVFGGIELEKFWIFKVKKWVILIISGITSNTLLLELWKEHSFTISCIQEFFGNKPKAELVYYEENESYYFEKYNIFFLVLVGSIVTEWIYISLFHSYVLKKDENHKAFILFCEQFVSWKICSYFQAYTGHCIAIKKHSITYLGNLFNVFLWLTLIM